MSLPNTSHAVTMSAIINKLLADAPPVAGAANDAPPRLMCQIILRTGSHIQGLLSRVEIDDAVADHCVLRMESHAQMQTKTGNIEAIAEHFFDYSDVACVTTVKPIEKPNVIRIGG